MRTCTLVLVLCVALAAARAGAALQERTEHFDRDPAWEARNNRVTASRPRQIRQDFGYSRTSHAGGQPGEMGGYINPAAETAFYGKRIAPRTFADPLTASGTFACPDGPYHLLLGFFNAGTAKEWRTQNTLALRLQGRGDYFYAYVEYCTSKWRAGGDSPKGFNGPPDPATGRASQLHFNSGGAVHRWSLAYDPKGAGGAGAITATIDDQTAVCSLDPGHRADGATFDHFGLMPVMKAWDDGGEVWLDDVTVLGETEHFDRDPKWDGRGNHRTYQSTNIRPRFDFGYSPTRYAGGRASGELGGLVFRGDCRYPERMGAYGDRLGALDMRRPLHAAGRVCLRRGVSDSTTLIGFYHSADSMLRSDSQNEGTPANFLGVAVEGPSREGFVFRGAYRPGQSSATWGQADDAPHILPDGKSHEWTLDYRPPAAGAPGEIRVTLDGRPAILAVPASTALDSSHLDRFGIVTTWIDGNSQDVYFDDLTYTAG